MSQNCNIFRKTKLIFEHFRYDIFREATIVTDSPTHGVKRERDEDDDSDAQKRNVYEEFNKFLAMQPPRNYFADQRRSRSPSPQPHCSNQAPPSRIERRNGSVGT